MNLKEYIEALTLLRDEYATDGYKDEDLTISGYLIGDGILLDPRPPFADGMTIHLDWERRPV